MWRAWYWKQLCLYLGTCQNLWAYKRRNPCPQGQKFLAGATRSLPSSKGALASFFNNDTMRLHYLRYFEMRETTKLGLTNNPLIWGWLAQQLYSAVWDLDCWQQPGLSHSDISAILHPATNFSDNEIIFKMPICKDGKAAHSAKSQPSLAM